MNLMQAVAKVLWADAAFQAASPGGIAAGVVPEGPTLPITTYMVVGGPSDPTFDGPGLAQYRVQFDCYSATYVDATAARKALTNALNAVRPMLIGDGSYFQGAIAISPQDFFENAPRQFRCMAEFYLYFNEV